MNLRIVALIFQFIINCWPKSNVMYKPRLSIAFHLSPLTCPGCLISILGVQRAIRCHCSEGQISVDTSLIDHFNLY